MINIVIKKISYRKSVLPINVPTISAQIAEKFPTRCSRNNEQQQETFELQPVQSHSRTIHVAPIHSEEQSVESLENSDMIQPIGVFEFAQIAERIPIRCRNNEHRQETLELQPVQSHSRTIHVAPIHSEEQSVESLENRDTIQPIEFIESGIDSGLTPVVPVQNFCLNNIKFNPDLIGSAGLTILFVIIFIVFYFYVGQIVFADDYETFVLLQHLYYCFPIALPTIYFVVNPKHLITALRDLPCNY